jgi:hypothetical protein
MDRVGQLGTGSVCEGPLARTLAPPALLMKAAHYRSRVESGIAELAGRAVAIASSDLSGCEVSHPNERKEIGQNMRYNQRP